MSANINVLYNIVMDITPQINEGGVSATLRARDYKDAQSVCVLNDQGGQQMSVTEDVCGTLRAQKHGHQPCVTNPVVRRLTPMECERLQGYPDGWTDIGDWVDSKGKKHKGDADAPRYKALGNSIALPFWRWMAERMVSYLETDHPTMASLFDGIGGFPLVFSECGCKPLWASEIEEFPIAVTKIRFKED